VKERGRGKGEEEEKNKKWRIFLYHDAQE